MRVILVGAIAAALLAVSAAGATRASPMGSGLTSPWVLTDISVANDVSVEINDRGQIAGEDGRHHAFLWQNGRTRDLGTLGGSESLATGINERGQVIGVSDTKVEGKCGGVPEPHGFVWQNGVMTDLGPCTWPEAINGSGQIVGDISTASLDKAFLWQSGRFTVLGQGDARLIDNRGDIAVNGFPRAFLWKHGRVTDFPEGTVPEAIDDRGRVVLASHGHGFHGNGFLWQSGTMSLLGSTDRDGFGGASAINDRGQIVGTCKTSHGGARPCLWEGRGVHDLGTPFGGHAGRALDINDHAQIVGYASLGPPSGKGAAFVWQDGHMTRLPTLRPGDGSKAIAINEHSEIVGVSQANRISGLHVVLWTLRQ